MTAEISVMNKHGIALAADSAVTVGGGRGPKIYSSVNKIFALSKYRPVGLMVYNNAELVGLPWETVVKTYRSDLKDRSFDSLAEYAFNFIEYLGINHSLVPSEAQQEYVRTALRHLYSTQVMQPLKEEVQARLKASKRAQLGRSEAGDLLETVVKKAHADWDRASLRIFQDEERSRAFLRTYEGLITKVIRELFRKMPVPDDVRRQLVELAAYRFSRQPPVRLPGTTGIVIAGYGEEDLFPSFLEFTVDGVANDEPVFWMGRTADINRERLSHVAAFAQDEMVFRFMEGVDPTYQQAIDESIDKLLAGYTTTIYQSLGSKQPSIRMKRQIEDARKELVEDFVNGLAEARDQVYVQSVTRAVASLPVDVLAEMAESLVTVTSIKRKVSLEDESVAGPIDVAVITRGDGFIWINRKHYFSKDRNPQFLANYYRES